MICYYIEKKEFRQIQISTKFNTGMIDRANIIRYNERILVEEMVCFNENFIKNALVLTMNDKEEVYSEGSVLIVDDKISQVGHFELKEDVDEVIDCKGKIVMPGLVNTHVHTSQQLGRGLGDDVNLLTWLHDRIWPYESNMTEEDSYVSTLACCLEQIKCGCTSFAEPGGQHVSGMARGLPRRESAVSWRNPLWTAARDCRKCGRKQQTKNWINRKKI